MQWEDVRVLLALLGTRNLIEAGARLDMDRSTVSRRLTALEQSLGVRLFSRTREGLRPTSAIERIRPYAERMEIEASALSLAAKATESEASGVVRVATTEALGAFLVAEGLLGLRDQHQDLVIEILGGNRPVDLERGEADIAVRMTPLRGADLRARCVAKMPIGLFASPSYLRSRGAIRGETALRGHDVLLPSGELTHLPEAKWLATRQGVRVVFQSSSMPALVAAAVQGMGVVPLTLAWGDRDPGLERVFAIPEIPRRSVWLVTHIEAGARPAVKVVGDRIVALFARAVGS
jgi:DNA-binding transcriptional LysR family regulator